MEKHMTQRRQSDLHQTPTPLSARPWRSSELPGKPHCIEKNEGKWAFDWKQFDEENHT
jgi:hypothetical protein